MSRLPLKQFQTHAVESGMGIFLRNRDLLDASPDPASRATAIHTHGYLLIEAPTGAGKTLIAGNLVERLSAQDNVVWFWFAPFRGVVQQTAAALQQEFAGLHVRSLATDRQPDDVRRGQVFVTTWGSVATQVADRRSIRRAGELSASLDELLPAVRRLGFRVGVVVDEAHHGFHGDTVAADFFRRILAPEYTVLITATPDDDDLADLTHNMQLGEVHRISVSRLDAVEAGLVKEGIQCIAWRADAERAAQVDFELTALREGRLIHQRLHAALGAHGIALKPLMLVQVDSSAGSERRAKAKLIGLGFTESQIAIHTAREPDAGLLALANDESREVLIFKMAVALGFDAPRAWTLVSMRAARDTDFGVQLVGRILRVHRRLQGRAGLDPVLNRGYVLLTDIEAQAGIGQAGDRINRLRTEYANVSPTTIVVQTGGQTTVQVVGPDGTPQFFPVAPDGALLPPVAPAPAPDVDGATGGGRQLAFPWNGEAGGTAPALATTTEIGGAPVVNILPLIENPRVFGNPTPAGGAIHGPDAQGRYRYPLRPGMPRQFHTQRLPEDFEPTEAALAQRFMVNVEALVDTLGARLQVQRVTLEVFTGELQRQFDFAPVSAAEMATRAEAILQSDLFDQKELWRQLVLRLTEIMRDRPFFAEVATDSDAVKRCLDMLLVTHPHLLRNARRLALAEGTQTLAAAPLPDALVSELPLPLSSGNVYGRRPPAMNGWEQKFAEHLDADTTGRLLWWHRNPVHQDWSVRLLLEDGSGFFPDFVLGIQGRASRHESGLLADTKFAFELRREQLKILAEHENYGRVLILHRSAENRWSMVRFDDGGRPVLGDEFRLVNAAGY